MQKPFAIMLMMTSINGNLDGAFIENHNGWAIITRELKLKISDACGKGLRKYYDNDKQYKSLKDNASSKVRVRK